MTPEELVIYRDSLLERYRATEAHIENLDIASADEESVDHQSDAVAEAIFLRIFTTYEIDIEKLFFHYVCGGACLQGRFAISYLHADEPTARKIVKGGFKFLSWAKPQTIRGTVNIYIQDGWPISAMMSAKSQDLSDCERVRNRIAHRSLEADMEFATVQRNLLGTERLFPLSPGQLLRMRHRRMRKTHLAHYRDIMRETTEAILEPPA